MKTYYWDLGLVLLPPSNLRVQSAWQFEVVSEPFGVFAVTDVSYRAMFRHGTSLQAHRAFVREAIRLLVNACVQDIARAVERAGYPFQSDGPGFVIDLALSDDFFRPLVEAGAKIWRGGFDG